MVPEHKMLADLGEFLQREKYQAESMGESFGLFSQLLPVLRDAGVPDRYDVLICDPPATEGPHLYNAINATRSLVIPVEASAKGSASVKGLEGVVEGMEDSLDIEVGVLAAVPTGFKNTKGQRKMLDGLEYDAPVVIGDRTSLMEGSWERQCSAFTFVREHRDRRRDYELDTLAQVDDLARHLEDVAGVEAPTPPDPGDVTHALKEVVR